MKKHLIFVGTFVSLAFLFADLAFPRLIFSQDESQFDALRLEKFLTVKAALLGVSDNISLYFEDLNHNEEIAFDPARSWIPASTIKAFVIPEAFRQRQIGLLNFNDTVTIKAENVVPTQMETDDFPTLTEGTTVTVGQLVEMMITQSDNTAYNTLLDLLDRRNINATLRHFGMTETVVGEKLNLDDSQSQADLNVPGRQQNTTTVKDFSTLFSLLYDKQIPNSDEILATFERQKLNDMIPLFLPKGTVIAHKTGVWNPIFHDGGIVYKTGSPFVFTVFSNSNDPTVVAELAKVAYFQNEDSVTSGERRESLSLASPEKTSKVYLASDETNSVLAAHTAGIINNVYRIQTGDTLWSIAEKIYGDGSRFTQIINRNPNINPADLRVGTELVIPNIPGNPSEAPKFPTITAADLGITKTDLTVDEEDVNKIRLSIINPPSLLYTLKIWWEESELARTQDNRQRIDLYLKNSMARLSEIKTLLSQKSKITEIEKLLVTSENDLSVAIDLAKNEPNRNEILFRVNRINDAKSALLASAPKRLIHSQETQFIDMVYSDYRRQKTNLSPSLASVKAANPLQQEPTIGKISAVEKNEVTLSFENGEIKKVALDSLTPVRNFSNRHLESISDLKIGKKIAVIGQLGPDGKVTPRFILNDMPNDLPNRYEGTVTKVDPGKNTLEIRDEKGQIDQISVNPSTTIKSKDTEVSLPGIRTGSTVTVYGSISPSQSGMAESVGRKGPSQPSAQKAVSATSITVTKNGSGKKEKEINEKLPVPAPTASPKKQ